jgi:dihydrodipicolinate synthase/N-acetylneuraminate lyase
MSFRWAGVFPAVTTQFREDQSLDLAATGRHLRALIASGVSGLVVCGSLGENQTLAPDEKRAVVAEAVKVSARRVPVVAGSGIAFPRENQHFWGLTRAGKWDEARRMYRWFQPLLKLDTHPKFVQFIKLAVQEVGLGAEWVRAPRQPLIGAERERVLAVIRRGLETRPKLG